MCFRDRHGMEGLDEYEIFCIFTPLGIFYSRRIYNEIHKENSRRKTFFLAEG